MRVAGWIVILPSERWPVPVVFFRHERHPENPAALERARPELRSLHARANRAQASAQRPLDAAGGDPPPPRHPPPPPPPTHPTTTPPPTPPPRPSLPSRSSSEVRMSAPAPRSMSS